VCSSFLSYLKEVILRFLLFENTKKPAERKALIPVICTVLQFEEEEKKQVMDAFSLNSSSWLAKVSFGYLGTNGSTSSSSTSISSPSTSNNSSAPSSPFVSSSPRSVSFSTSSSSPLVSFSPFCAARSHFLFVSVAFFYFFFNFFIIVIIIFILLLLFFFFFADIYVVQRNCSESESAVCSTANGPFQQLDTTSSQDF
jgi:hypothetical protein